MRRILIVTIAAAISACGGCDKEKTTPTGTLTPPGKQTSIALQPLPEPPALNIPQDQLPGADGALAVVAARPKGEAPQLDIRPTVTFNKPVKSLEQVEAQRASDKEAPFATISPSLEGEWRWLGSSSAEFVPKAAIPFSTDFTVTIQKGLKAIDGAALADDYSFTFSTPRLELQSEFPRRGYKWLKPDQQLKLTFNQPIDEATLIQGAKFEAGGQILRLQVLDRISVADQRKKDREAQGNTRRHEEYDPEDAPAFGNKQMVYTVAPEKPFPAGAPVAFILDSGVVHAKEGARTPKGERIEWSTYGKMELKEARACTERSRCPYGPLYLYATNPIALDSLKTRLKIQPAVEVDWEASHTWEPDGRFLDQSNPWARIAGKFRPGTDYTITLDQGVTDVFNQPAAAFNGKIHTDDLAPALVTGGTLALIEAGNDAPLLPVEVSNLQSLDVTLWKLSVPELVRAAIKNPYDETPVLDRTADFSEAEKLTYPKNLARVHPIKLSKVLGDKKTGVVMLAINSPNLEYKPPKGYRQIAQVTDLAVHLKVAPKSSLAWVTRLSTGAPVEGADVSLYDQDANEKWKGKTDSKGLAEIPGTVALKITNAQYQWEFPKVVAVAKAGDDLSFTANTWATGVEPYEFGIDTGWEAEKPEPTGFIFTDRGIYRPGDKVHVKGVVRWREVGELKRPEDSSQISLSVKDSNGNAVTSTEVKVTKYGTFSLEVPIPKEAPLGWYSIDSVGKAKNGGPVAINGSFRVEEYRAPQFRVDVETAKKSLISGESLEAKVFARYLFGGAMGNAKAKWSVVRKTTSFSSPAAPDFGFGDQTWWWDDNAPHSTSNFFAGGEGLLDSNGALPVVAGKVEAPGDSAYLYTVEGEVEDVNRQTVAGRVEVPVHPSSFYVGLRLPTGFMKAGTEYGLDTVVVNTEGNRVAGRALEVQVLRRTWKSVKRKEAGGGFVTLSEPSEEEVHKCALKSAGDAPVPCQFKPKAGGLYIVKATVKDDAGRKHQSSVGGYVLGAGFSAWQRNDTDRIELVPDKTKYDVGDVAKVLVKSPYPEARAMVTVEREGVLERRVVELKGSMEAIEVPITEAMVPNVFVGVLLVRPRVAQGGVETGDDPGRPVARIGFARLAVERTSKRLSVKVTTPKSSYQPGQDVEVKLEVKDREGKAANAEVTLYAVDEAVLRLTDYETPDPIARIFPDRPLSVRLGEPLLHLVRKRNYGEKGEPAGGGGGEGEGKGIRNNFKTTALWLPALEVVNGEATAKFKLPDNLTTFRIMAVAITQGERFGQGQTEIQVNKPVLALPSLPRFARVGDRFEAGVVVHTHQSAAGEVTVKAEVQGLKLEGPAEQKVQVAEGAPKEVRFQFVAERAGTARFVFRAQKGSDSDGVEEKIPVELPVAMEAVATYGDTKERVLESISTPKDVLPDQGGLTMTLASTSMSGLDQGFSQLIEYPYGCLEQQSSRLVPFIALREIAGQYGIAWSGGDAKKKAAEDEFNAFLRTYLGGTLQVNAGDHPDQIISSTVRSILALQDSSGGFRYWPDSGCTWSWASAYAALALTRAKEVGYAVPQSALTKAEGFLTRVAGGNCACERACDDETRTFAVYTLAKMKKPKPSFYGPLYAGREKLSLFARALLVNAMATGGGDRKQANALLQEILNHAKESPKGLTIAEVESGSYATTFQSDTRTTAVVLQTLVNLQPDHPFVGKMTRALKGVRQGDGQWRTTQEAAFSLMALVEVMRVKEKDVPDFKATVALGGKELINKEFKGRSMKVETAKLLIDQLPPAGGEKLSIAKEGAGVLYYSAVLKYAPKQMPTQSLDNGLFVQRWFEPYSGGGQATKFAAGDLVRVRVRVASNQERHWLAVEVPLPAGLEAVDTSLATSSRNQINPDDEGMGEGYEPEADDERPSYGFWSPFSHLEYRDSKLLAFADHLPAGVHLVSFVARATTPGDYVLKPARGELMYEPEVWGRSEGGRFEVALPTPVSQK
jgi:alpha-2-macroglobulin